MGRVLRVLLATILLGSAMQIACCAQAPAPEAKSPPVKAMRERFSALVKQLGSVSYREREAASEALFDLGPGVLNWIIKRQEGEPDAEIQQRLEQIRWVLECQTIRTVEDAERAFRRCVESEISLYPQPKHIRLRKILSSREALKALERLCPASEITKRTADLMFHSGLMWYQRYRQGNDDHNHRPLENARRGMERAIDLYSAWLKTHPNDKEADTHLIEASMIFYACRKLARV